jgi:hypothetical protein
MANETLIDAIDWKTYAIAAGLASGFVPVRIGTAGTGGPVGVLSASVHGDEGPWSTIAINRMLSRAKVSELTGTLRIVPVANPLATERHALGQAGVMTEVDAEGPDPMVGGAKIALTTSAPGIYHPVIRERGLASVVEAGTLIGELLDPVSSQVIEQYVAPYERSCLALLRPTIARIEAPGKVVAVVADVTEATQPRG